MGERDTSLEHFRKREPEAFALMNSIENKAVRLGSKGASVFVTDEMTPEEQEMALTEGFLKEGYSLEQSLEKASEWREAMDSLFSQSSPQS